MEFLLLALSFIRIPSQFALHHETSLHFHFIGYSGPVCFGSFIAFRPR